MSQTNYTLTYFADHRPGVSHDAVKRYLQEEKLTARMVCEHVRGERLVLDKPDNVMLENTERIIFRVTLIDLAIVGVSGAGSIASDSLDVENLSAYLSGTGNITLSGNVDQQMIDLSGSGNYHGSDLFSRETSVTIGGTGNAVVNSTDMLSATISGTGFVQYLGSPQVTENISGVGSVISFSGES